MNLTIHIGNDARVAGLYLTDITEANKLKGYDQDVVIGGDVWILQVYWLLSQFFHIIYVLVTGIVHQVQWSIDQILEHESNLYPSDKKIRVRI